MTNEQIDDLFLVGKFMEIENLFVYETRDSGVLGIYKAEDESGCIDYTDVGINFYDPDRDWNTLMKVYKKIISVNSGNKENIIKGLQECDIKATYQACVNFIKDTNKKGP